MKLNKKVPLLILPVLLLSFLLTGVGLYIIARNSVYSLAQSSIAHEATELSGSFSQYNLVAIGFLASIVQSDSLHRFLETDDKQLKSLALNSGLDDILKNLGTLSSDHFSIIFVQNDGKIEYYYENSLDPFAKPDPSLLRWSTTIRDKHQSSATEYFQDLEKIGYSRTINRITLEPVLNFESEDSLTIIISLNPKDFLDRSARLEEKGHVAVFHDKDDNLPNTQRFESRRAISGLGTISVKLDKSTVEASLWQTLWKLGLSFIILAGLTHFALQWLLYRYIIGPINRLESQLSNIDLDETQEITIHHSKDEIGNLSNTFSLLYDKLKDTYEVTKDLAERDALTTLYNRRVFNLILEKLISRTKKDNHQMALLYMDIDNFKFVNDNYGHTVGDELLRAFAYRLHEIVRGTDIILNSTQDEGTTVARLAGDEFAVIINGYTDKDTARKVSQRLLALCDNGFTCEAGTFPISLSIGVAAYPQDGQTAEELTVNADSAMYESKKSGKNTVSYYSRELSNFFRRQQTVEIELKSLDVNELVLYYMPIVDAKTGQIKSLEALVRWFSPSLGFVSPAEFIPLAENIGVYQKIDLWVIEEAFRESPRLRTHFGESLKISINISAAELSRIDFLDKLQGLIDKHQILPPMFILEITETFYKDNSTAELRLLQALSTIGFQLAIDDFGSGYTSLIQLVEFPINIVKIDHSFIDKTIENGKETVLDSLVKFCHSQQLSITAEGVETEEYSKRLTQAGFDYLQGYFYSRPLPPDELMSIM
ncbi:MAG: diguanylate cyclase (GGDEF)-like protein [Desulforhopalus sp.]|jgi:diguanylate cyclase (GGDEF)-like protein